MATVPIPQDATVGYDQPQSQQTASPASQPTGAGVVPIPADATVGYGEDQKKVPVALNDIPGNSVNDFASNAPNSNSEDLPLTSYGAATRQGFNTVANSALNVVKGAYGMVHPMPKDDGEKEALKTAGIGGMLIYRLIKGTGQQAESLHPTQIAAAIHDINTSDDPLGTYAKFAQKTFSDLGAQGLALAVSHGVSKSPVTSAVTKAAKNIGGVPAAVGNYVKQVVGGEGVAQPAAESALRSAADVETPEISAEAPAAARKPNWAYRVQPKGTKAVVPGTSAQFTSDPQWAQGMADNKPIYPGIDHEVARVDLNTLNPEDYTSTTENTPKTANGEPATWTRVHRTVGKNEMQIHSTHPFNAPSETMAAEEPAAAAESTAPAKTSAPVEKVSLRKVMQPATDNAFAEAKSLYKPIDEAAGTDFKGLYDKLDAAMDRERLTAPGSPEEAKALTDITNTKTAIEDAKVRASKSGIADVDKSLDQADAKFTEAQANKDLNAKLFNNQGVIKGNVAHGAEESINIDKALDVLEDMDKPNKYGPSRLKQTSLGEDGAFKLKQDLYDAQKLGKTALSKQQFIRRLARYGLYTAGAGMSAHFLLPH